MGPIPSLNFDPMKPFSVPLAGAWVALCGAFVYASTAAAGASEAATRTLLSQLALVHVGLVLGVSFTESWVKLRAPLLERHVGLDVGRHVFSALNVVELVVSATSVLALASRDLLVAPQRGRPHPLAVAPVATLAVVLLQALVLAPALERRAFFVIADKLKDKRHATRAEEELYKELKAKTALTTPPGMWVHHVYVLLELAKVVGLAYFAVSSSASAP